MSSLSFRLLILFFFAALAGRAAPNDGIFDSWRWVTFTTAHGLPSNAVTLIAETPTRLWAVTSHGIAWYDNYQWHPVGPAQGLPSGPPRRITPTSDGSLLVTINDRLFRGDERGFTPIPLILDGQPLVIDSAHPLSSSLLLLHSGRSLYEYDGATLRPHRPSSLPSSTQVSLLFHSQRGHIWINTSAGLYRWENNAWHRELSATVTAVTGYFHTLNEAANGERFALARYGAEQGLYTWSPASAGPPQRHLDPAFIAGDISRQGDILALDIYGRVWFRQTNHWTALLNPPRPLTQATFLQFRANGDLWVGTRHGLLLCRRSSDLWSSLPARPGGAHTSVNDLLRSRDGTLWIASGAGLMAHHPDRPASWFDDFPGQTRSPEVTAINQAPDGALWIGSGSGFPGALRFDGAAWVRPTATTPLPNIHKIRRDRSGRLWLLGLTQDFSPSPNTPTPLCVFQLAEDRIVPWEHSRQLPSGRVYAFDEAPDGALWFGTAAGLSRWRSGVWTHWRSSAELKPGRIYSLVVDAYNRVWFADRTNGLGLLENNAVRYLTTSDGLVSNEVTDLSLTADATLWIATRDGLSSRRADGTWSRFTDGLSNPALWPVLSLPDRVIVGSAAGVDVLRTDRFLTPGNRVLIPTPSILHGVAQVRWQVLPRFGLVPPDDVETRFRLNDGPWSPWSLRREHTFADIDHGDHQFDVQAKDPLGRFADSTTSQTFKIPPPLLLRLPVLLAIGLLLAGAATFAFLHLRRRALHAREIARAHAEIRDLNTRLEQRVRERTAELQAAVHELESFSYSVSHDLRAPLRGIDGWSLALAEDYADRLDDRARDYLARVRSEAQRMSTLIDDLIDLARVSRGELSPTAVDLSAIANRLLERLRAAEPSRSVESLVTPGLAAPGDPVLLELLLQNLLANAWKFSAKRPTARIEFGHTETPKGPAFFVRDNGAGFDMARAAKLFTPFNRLHKPSDFPGTGIGLATVQRVVRRHGGQVWAEATPDEGATFYFTLSPAPQL